jgi:hypothetical protein
MSNNTVTRAFSEAGEEAAVTILSVMRDARTPPGVRLPAAEIFLHTGELAERVVQLEKSIAEAIERQKWSLPG